MTVQRIVLVADPDRGGWATYSGPTDHAAALLRDRPDRHSGIGAVILTGRADSPGYPASWGYCVLRDDGTPTAGDAGYDSPVDALTDAISAPTPVMPESEI